MDFIIKLPLSKELFTGEIYNLIIIIVNRYIKYITIILFKEEYIII